MKPLITKIVVAVLVTVALAGCGALTQGTVTQESATQWLQRQAPSD